MYKIKNRLTKKRIIKKTIRHRLREFNKRQITDEILLDAFITIYNFLKDEKK